MLFWATVYNESSYLGLLMLMINYSTVEWYSSITQRVTYYTPQTVTVCGVSLVCHSRQLNGIAMRLIYRSLADDTRRVLLLIAPSVPARTFITHTHTHTSLHATVNSLALSSSTDCTQVLVFRQVDRYTAITFGTVGEASVRETCTPCTSLNRHGCLYRTVGVVYRLAPRSVLHVIMPSSVNRAAAGQRQLSCAVVINWL